MTIEQIMQSQFALSESRKENPVLKGRVQRACSNWAEKSRKYGIIPVSKNFNRGR